MLSVFFFFSILNILNINTSKFLVFYIETSLDADILCVCICSNEIQMQLLVRKIKLSLIACEANPVSSC